MALRRAAVLACLAAACVAFGADGAAAQSGPPVVVELRIDGVVDPFIADHVEGGIADAADDGAAAVLLTLDTPGGLDSSMRQITQAILNAEIPVIGYVSPQGARAPPPGRSSCCRPTSPRWRRPPTWARRSRWACPAPSRRRRR
jgi:membrane-bound serine protease (ClpP class)